MIQDQNLFSCPLADEMRAWKFTLPLKIPTTVRIRTEPALQKVTFQKPTETTGDLLFAQISTKKPRINN